MTTRLKLAAGLAAAILCAGMGGAFAATTLDNDTSVMARASANSRLIGTLTAGQVVKVASQASSWCKISAPTAGWISCNDINGLASARTNAAPAAPAPKGYDYDSDPVLGPHGGFHTVYEGQSH
jgi:hypothetical protein